MKKNNLVGVKKIVLNINEFIAKSSLLMNRYESKPENGSLYLFEAENYSNRNLVETSASSGFLSIEIAADHLMGISSCLIEPIKTISPWTCARGLLESSALSIWLLDPNISANERVGRNFAFRYSEFTQQLKMYSISNNLNEISRINKRINDVERDSIKVGFTPVIDKNGKRCGIGQNMPPITEMIRTTLNKEIEYRLLSAVAHGHYWAIQQISFQRIPHGDNTANLRNYQKSGNLELINYLVNIALTSFSKSIWFLWIYFGWNRNEIIELLNETFDKLNYSSESRIWNT